jgi:hypothetical protein
VLARLAEEPLVVLIIEDVHWIDRSSRDLRGFLVPNARRDRLLFVATYRPDELHRGHPLRACLAELEQSGQAQRLDLEPLGRAELAAQLGAIIGTRPASATIDRIFTRCEGNPFFAEELLATVDADRPDHLPGSLREALLPPATSIDHFGLETELGFTPRHLGGWMWSFGGPAAARLAREGTSRGFSGDCQNFSS